MSVLDIAVVGAGPYGLSVAAHLKAAGAEFRLFGPPMRTWLEHMPKGMMLKSDGFASSLSSPEPGATLAEYCAEKGLAYHETQIPVPLQTFTDYALDFQRRFAPTLEPRLVTELDRSGNGYRLTLDDGEVVEARRVVAAVGITHFAYTPEPLAHLPLELASHASAHHHLEDFAGREVTVIGAGSSAVDLAALLHEAGASVRLAARGPVIKFFSEPTGKRPSLAGRLRHPPSGLGPGWRSRLCCDVPQLFRYLPAPLRLEVVRRHLGPKSAWGLKARTVGKLPILLGHRLAAAEPFGDRLLLKFDTTEGQQIIETDHVIAATGYRADLRRLPFMSGALRAQIRQIDNAPLLSPYFEASTPGLFLPGPAAANSFGPLMRFMYGDAFAARRITRRLMAA